MACEDPAAFDLRGAKNRRVKDFGEKNMTIDIFDVEQDACQVGDSDQ